MKFYHYINEQELDEHINLIKKDCSYYLNLLDKHNLENPFYRGILTDAFFTRKQVRKNRQPKATNIEAFNEINDYFEDKGHVRRDNSVIATSNEKWVQIFGNLYMIFPIGKFDYSWIKLPDFNVLKSYKKISEDARSFIKGVIPEDDDKIESILAEIEPLITTNKGVDRAHKKGFEIWFSCSEYYLLKADPDEGGVDPKNILSMLKRG